MKESLAYAHLRRVWYPGHPGAFLMRVENRVGPGTPDVYACWRGVSAWFESKVLEGTSDTREGWQVLRPRHVTQAQPPWWRGALRADVPLFGALKRDKWPRGAVMFIRLPGLIRLEEGLTEPELKLYEVHLDSIFEKMIRPEPRLRGDE
jgi:hypothetical protein